MARKNFYLQRFEEEASPINLTPLIDVVFVILIMFILIAPILEMDQIELAESSPSSKNISLLMKEESPVSIRVDSRNKVFINEVLVKEENWPAVLKNLKASAPDAKPMLFHDKRAAFGTYQKIKSVLEKAGYQEVDLVLAPKE